MPSVVSQAGSALRRVIGALQHHPIRMHLVAVGIFVLLALTVTWPLVPQIHQGIAAIGYDGLHNLWLLGHTREAILAHQPLFAAPLLYYPDGSSLLTHGLGPVMGLFAFPFWGWGPAVAHNAAALIAFVLNGYAMYLLARELGFDQRVALFGGIGLMLAPMTAAGFYGHMTKLFVAGLPLTLLGLHRALQPDRHLIWVAAPATALGLVLLHSGYQFVLAGLACAFFGMAYWLGATDRSAVFRRGLLAATVIAVTLTPLLSAIVRAAADPAIQVERSREAEAFRPDLLLVLLPSFTSRFVGGWSRDLAAQLGLMATLETAVSPGWVVGFLALLGLWKVPAARVWGWFGLICVILALGPALQVAGISRFTDFDYPIMLPFAVLSSLPGLGFFRIPGRFMLIGAVGLIVAAGYGLIWLSQRWPNRWPLIFAGAIGLLLFEGWPQPVPIQPLPDAPAFYREIAVDAEQYGVFDLPARRNPDIPSDYVPISAYYQYFQLLHGKGIASGYLSRVYQEHPRFAELLSTRLPERNPAAPLTVDGGSPAYLSVEQRLADAGYRYVVWHHNLVLEPPAQAEAARLVELVFGDRLPIVDTETTTVYAVQPGPVADFEVGPGWYDQEQTHRWAGPKAHLHIDMRRAQEIVLVLTSAAIFDPQTPDRLGAWGELVVTVNAEAPIHLEMVVDQPLRIPLTLPAGESTLTLELAAGSFQPSTADPRDLSFAVRSLDLETQP
jgi:hypothetical protein